MAFPNVHDFTQYSSSTVYNLTQTNEEIKDGDILLFNKGIGFLMKAWPVCLYGEAGELHQLDPQDTEQGRMEVRAEYGNSIFLCTAAAAEFSLLDKSLIPLNFFS